MAVARLAGVVCALWAIAGSHAAPRFPEHTDDGVGEAIYLRGTLPSGASLVGAQSRMGVQLHGAEAACVNCHQRSGLGSHEGPSSIPPVTGEYLFKPRLPGEHDVTMPLVTNPHGGRSAYTDTTLAHAIRSGRDSDGRALSDLMPRFDLDDASMAALIAYLRILPPRRMQGVIQGQLHVATVITPDADPAKRRGMLDVLEHYVAEKHGSPVAAAAGKATDGARLANGRWQLHIWTLAGTPETWRAQLERQYAAEPVFAILSGLGGAQWGPVHEFCEQHAVPCLFPNIEVPVVAEHDFYSVYFSKGVLLEARLIANAIISGNPQPGAAVHQIYRRGDSGAEAAAELANTLRDHNVIVTDEGLPAEDTSPGILGDALSRAPASSTLVLWGRPHDIASLDSTRPPAGRIYLSGLMSGLDSIPLPTAWRSQVALSYPFELPQRRRVQLDYPLGWFAFRHIPIVDQQTQADTFLACSLLTDTLSLMSDRLSPAYLMEQLQRLLEHRTITGYYPRLTLGTGQHFASRGGYIVHYGVGATLVADTPWTIP